MSGVRMLLWGIGRGQGEPKRLCQTTTKVTAQFPRDRSGPAQFSRARKEKEPKRKRKGKTNSAYSSSRTTAVSCVICPFLRIFPFHACPCFSVDTVSFKQWHGPSCPISFPLSCGYTLVSLSIYSIYFCRRVCLPYLALLTPFIEYSFCTHVPFSLSIQ